MNALTQIATSLDLEGKPWKIGPTDAWQFTDKIGITFYVPANSSASEVRKRYNEKKRQFATK